MKQRFIKKEKIKLRVDVPGKFDEASVANIIGKTGKLTFVGPDKTVILTGDDVKSATSRYRFQTGKPAVNLNT